MLTTLEKETRSVNFSEIDLGDSTYRFRLESPDFDKFIASDLKARGQVYPVTLIDTMFSGYTVLDGLSRCRVMGKLAQTGEIASTVRAHVIQKNYATPLACFQRLCVTNMAGAYAYGVYEKGQFFKFFLEKGLTIFEMAKDAKMTPHEIEDLIELANAPAEIGSILNGSELDPAFLVMLVRRTWGWLNTPFGSKAQATIRALLEKSQKELMSVKSWRFYLDFYWNSDRPFMTR